LESPGIESRKEEHFVHQSYQPWCPPSLLYYGYHVIPGVKGSERGVKHSTPSSTEDEGSRVMPLLPL